VAKPATSFTDTKGKLIALVVGRQSGPDCEQPVVASRWFMECEQKTASALRVPLPFDGIIRTDYCRGWRCATCRPLRHPSCPIMTIQSEPLACLHQLWPCSIQLKGWSSSRAFRGPRYWPGSGDTPIHAGHVEPAMRKGRAPTCRAFGEQKRGLLSLASCRLSQTLPAADALQRRPLFRSEGVHKGTVPCPRRRQVDASLH
jgi:hypothetical protein